MVGAGRIAPMNKLVKPSVESIRSHVVAVLATCAVAVAAGHACAQEPSAAPPAAPPATPPNATDIPTMPGAPPPARKLAEGWSAEATSAESVKRGEKALEDLSKAFKDAPMITNRINFKLVGMPADPNNALDAAFAAGDKFRLTAANATMVAIDGSLYLEESTNTRKYIRRPIEGGISKTIEEIIPGGGLPVPIIALRDGATGPAAVKAFAGTPAGVVSDLAVVGFRTVDGSDRLLLKGSNGDMEVVIDPKTKLIDRIDAVVSPQATVPGMPSALAIQTTFEPALPTSIEPPITAPVANGRKEVTTMEEFAAPIAIGDSAIDFELPDTSGNIVKTADLKGNVVVFELWGTWCRPCLESLPKVNEFAKWAAESGKPIKLYGVACEVQTPPANRLQVAKTFWAGRNYSFPTLVDVDLKFAGGYGIQAFPSMIIIGPDGKVAAFHQGFDPEIAETLKKDVEKALQPAPAAG